MSRFHAQPSRLSDGITACFCPPFSCHPPFCCASLSSSSNLCIACQFREYSTREEGDQVPHPGVWWHGSRDRTLPSPPQPVRLPSQGQDPPWEWVSFEMKSNKECNWNLFMMAPNCIPSVGLPSLTFVDHPHTGSTHNWAGCWDWSIVTLTTCVTRVPLKSYSATVTS